VLGDDEDGVGHDAEVNRKKRKNKNAMTLREGKSETRILLKEKQR